MVTQNKHRMPGGLVAGILILLLVSCSTSQRSGFGKKTPREKYAARLESAGLQTTAMGSLWFASADKSLAQPLTISLPYKETGYFAPDNPTAAGYRFTAKTGQKLLITIQTIPATGVVVFTELWQAGTEKNEHKLLDIVDTLKRQLQYEVEEETDFLVRLQPELLKGIEYTLIVTTQPSLAFPVNASGNPNLISLWGMDRDAGARRHEGIDIAATFRTPAIAAADGRILHVNENNLGGKVVFLRPNGKAYHLYYAHLDSQLVRQGQQVKQGDVIGLIGNTGNAKTTPSHLHFGIYTARGAIDPFPFVDPTENTIPAITAPLGELNQFVYNRAAASLYTGPAASTKSVEKLEPGMVLKIISATGNWYKVQLPDEREAFIDSDVVTKIPQRKMILEKQTRLLDEPDSNAAAQTVIKPGKTVAVLGKYENYSFVAYQENKGWIKKE